MFSRFITMPLTAGLLAVCASTPFAAVAVAADNGSWYAGAGIGYAKNTIDNPFIKPYFDYDGVEEKTSATGFKLYGGYQFNQYWAAEVTYLGLGKYSMHYAGAFSTVKTSGLGLSAVGFLPLSEEFTLLGKAGALANATAIEQHHIDYSFAESWKTTHVAPLLGVGAEYRLTPAMFVRAEYDYAGNTPVGRNATLTNQLLSLSLRHQF